MEIKKINNPIWPDTIRMRSFPRLTKDIKTDYLVVGGGICGILVAHKLKELGLNVVLVEASSIGRGITERTTAFVSSQHDTMYHELVKEIGFSKAKLYLEANLDAIKEYEKLSLKYDFDYKSVDSCFYSTNKENSEKVNKEIEILKQMNYDAKLINQIPLPIDIESGVLFEKQGQMNPLKLISLLSEELTIYENTKVLSITSGVCITEHNFIEAKNIIICTHFPIYNNILYSMRMYQTRSYVLAMKYNNELNGLYTDIEEGGLYFRKYKDYLIVGGCDRRTGTSDGSCSKSFGYLENYLKERFDEPDIKYAWANQDLITLDSVPYIGKINSCKENIYVATGFNLWGMTHSMISAMVISDLVMDKKNKYEKLYKPNRCMIKKNLFKNMGELIKDEIGVNKKRCTHMGCVLTFNKCEKSWDCPCHGSRFSFNGDVLNTPARRKLKNKKK